MTFPANIPKLCSYFLLLREEDEPEEFEGVVRVTLDEQIIHEYPVNGSFHGKLRTRMMSLLEGMPVPRPGLMRFTFNYKDEALGHWDIIVENIGKPKAKMISDAAHTDGS